MFRRSMLIVSAMFLIGMSVCSFAWGSNGIASEKRFEKLSEKLALTQVQKDKYMASAKQLADESKEINKKNKEIYAEIEKELAKDVPDPKIIHDYISQIGQNRTQIQIKRIDQIIGLKKELTFDQKLKFDKLMQERKGHINKKHDKFKRKDK